MITVHTALAMALLALAACAAQVPEVKDMDIVVIETSMGNMEIKLDAEKAPATVENFKRYVNEGFYDGTVFHRVIKDFMIQGGGFTPDGTQKPAHEPISLEAALPNKRGTIAMARTMDPDSATAQFFINVVDNDFLNPGPGNPGYAVFGEVISGMDVADRIRAVQTTSKHGMADWPEEEVVIRRVYLKT